MSAVISREEVRDELKLFLSDTFSKDLQDLCNRMHKDVIEEIARFLRQASLEIDVARRSEDSRRQPNMEPLPSKATGSCVEPPREFNSSNFKWFVQSSSTPQEVTEPSGLDSKSVTLKDESSMAPTDSMRREGGCDLLEEGEKMLQGIDEDNKDVMPSPDSDNELSMPLPNAVPISEVPDPYGLEALRNNALVCTDSDSEPPPTPVIVHSSEESTYDDVGEVPTQSQRLSLIGDGHLRPNTKRQLDEIERRTHRRSGRRNEPGFTKRLSNTEYVEPAPISYWIVRNIYFDYVVSVILVFNAILMGVEVDYMADVNDDLPPTHFRVFDWLFCIAFTAELSIRLYVDGLRLYIKSGWQWSVFDTVIVGFQILDEFTQLIFVGGTTRSIIEKMGVLRILRLGRVLRLFRMVRLVPELKSMVYLIAASMGSFFWTLALLLLMIYCVAVYFTELACDLAKTRSDDGPDIRHRWGSVPTSILSLFQAITGGEDWAQFTDVFRGESQFFLYTVVFCIYIAFAMLVMLNLVTGVFVEGAQRIIKEDKDNELIRHVCKLFHVSDEDASLSLSFQEFQDHLDDEGFDTFFKTNELNKQDAKHLFKLLDDNHDSTLTIEEFVRGTVRLRGPARSVDLATLSYDFHAVTRKWAGDLTRIEAKLEKLVSVAADTTKHT